jgi:hypothetical protein
MEQIYYVRVLNERDLYLDLKIFITERKSDPLAAGAMGKPKGRPMGGP